MIKVVSLLEKHRERKSPEAIYVVFSRLIWYGSRYTEGVQSMISKSQLTLTCTTGREPWLGKVRFTKKLSLWTLIGLMWKPGQRPDPRANTFWAATMFALYGISFSIMPVLWGMITPFTDRLRQRSQGHSPWVVELNLSSLNPLLALGCIVDDWDFTDVRWAVLCNSSNYSFYSHATWMFSCPFICTYLDSFFQADLKPYVQYDCFLPIMAFC